MPNRIEGFSGGGREAIAALFRPMLAIAERWAERRGDLLNVVMHGAVSRSRRREDLREDTRQFLAWALDEFPLLRLALENAHPPALGEIKVGDTRASVVEMVSQLDHPRLGICWDMGHDYLSDPPKGLDPEWISRVVHIHMHDVNETGVDHFPLVYGRVPYAIWLAALRDSEADPTVVLEIKGSLLAGWSGAAITRALVDSFSAVREALG
jgi:sugar phosphate isomerase/epimerase